MSDRFVLIGHPVQHSVSPAIHEAAYRQLEHDGRYDLADCPDAAAVEHQIAMIASGQLRGANVTVPWKRLAFDLADVHAPSAVKVGVANVLCRDEQGQVVAHNTDATALGDELKRLLIDAGHHEEAQPTALVIGNGGAARAAVVACQLAGVDDVGVTARSFSASTPQEIWTSRDEFVKLGASLIAWPIDQQGKDDASLEQYLTGCRLLVQATSAGMKGTTGGEQLAELIPWKALPRAAAYDLVYNPVVTPFLRRAELEGHTVRGGLGMLVGQAAHAIELWWGVRPEQEPLLQAARKALSL